MKVGNLVRCTETGRTGIIIEMQRTLDSMMTLVNWATGALWTDAVELEILDSSP